MDATPRTLWPESVRAVSVGVYGNPCPADHPLRRRGTNVVAARRYVTSLRTADSVLATDTGKIPTDPLSSTQCGSSAANFLSSSLFPPQDRKAYHKAVLAEILEERVVSSRGRQIPRGVKRKMSNFPLRRGHTSDARRINYSKHIKVIK